MRNQKDVYRVDSKQHFNSVPVKSFITLATKEPALLILNAFECSVTSIIVTQHNAWRKKFSPSYLSLQSICWKKMSQTPLKVIGLDHHYTFYSMS